MPVEISQIFAIPSKWLVITMPSFACRVMDLIGAEERGVDRCVDFGLFTAGSVDWAPICQSLTESSIDAEMRVVGEENTREVMLLAWPMKVSTR